MSADEQKLSPEDLVIDAQIRAAFDAAFGVEPNFDHLRRAMTKLADAALGGPPPGCAILTGAEAVAISLEIRRLNRRARKVEACRDALREIIRQHDEGCIGIDAFNAGANALSALKDVKS